MSNNKDINDKRYEDGITTHIYGNDTYVFWRVADIVYPYVFDFLQKKFPNSIIVREFNKIDIAILKENLPAEIQSTPAHTFKKDRRIIKSINHSEFEQKIEKQLKQKTDKYGKGLFFFDSEYHRYLQTNLTKISRINWDWFYNYIKIGRLRVFTVRYDGYINEVFPKDFEFISRMSQICPRNKDSDKIKLEMNKLRLLDKIYKYHKFTTIELHNMYEIYRSKSVGTYSDFDEYLNRDGHTNREVVRYYIGRAINSLEGINDILDQKLDMDKKYHMKTYAHLMKVIGLIDSKSVNKGDDLRTFSDYADIAEFFPGYQRNKKLWDDLKTRWIKYDTLCGLATGEIDERKLNFQISIEKAWS